MAVLVWLCKAIHFLGEGCEIRENGAVGKDSGVWYELYELDEGENPVVIGREGWMRGQENRKGRKRPASMTGKTATGCRYNKTKAPAARSQSQQQHCARPLSFIHNSTIACTSNQAGAERKSGTLR